MYYFLKTINYHLNKKVIDTNKRRWVYAYLAFRYGVLMPISFIKERSKYER